jgi:type II secretory pathway component GspD/PulD (secretin)
VQIALLLVPILLVMQMGGAAAQELEPTTRPRLAPRIPNQTPPAPPAPEPPSPPENFITQTVPVNHWPTAEMKKLLAALVRPGGTVLDQPGDKFLIVVDAPQNIQRLIEIKGILDDPALAGKRMDFFQMKTASAEELAAQMTELGRAQFFPAALSAEFIPLPASNQLLTLSRNEAAWTDARKWIERLDRSAGSQRRIFVYPVVPGRIIELADKWAPLQDERKDGDKTNPSAQKRPRINFDPTTQTLIIYATAEEFQEIKNDLNPGAQMEAFKQRLSALRRKSESDGNKTEPASVKSPY